MVDCDHPAERVRRTVVAQELLDRTVDQAGVGRQPFPLARMLQQHQDGIADEVRRCLVSPEQNEDTGRDEFVLGQGFVLVTCGNQAAEQVVPGVCPTLRQQCPEQAGNLAHAIPRAFILVRNAACRSDEERKLV